ncbi:MAG: DegT/DnrJ/EryC1/StrS family aminotransferase, partial [candidate division Zixibacteria bacterium]|nr:DegT/DnrJ/EryC1/StrS family aminotransferase [candidate division Zixibacteria bacterium]
AILPVHLNGRMCDIEGIMNLAKKNNLLVIEDAAQALGGSYNRQKAGSFGLAGCFSFYPAKTLGATGDAGAVVTNSQALFEKLLLLRDHGRLNKTDLGGWGYNCRLDNLQAAILDLKLKYLPEWIRRRRELAGLYHKYLAHLPQITLPPAPTNEGLYYDVYQNFVIEAENRDQLFEHLTRNGIETLISWPKAVHHQKPLGLSHFKLPRTDELCRKVISLPLTTELENEQIEYVAKTIEQFYSLPAYQSTAKITEATLQS